MFDKESVQSVATMTSSKATLCSEPPVSTKTEDASMEFPPGQNNFEFSAPQRRPSCLRASPVRRTVTNAALVLFLISVHVVSARLNSQLRFCVDEITAGRHESAIQVFKTNGDKTTLSAVVTTAYNGRVANTENILNFVRGLPGMDYIGIGYQALFNEMVKHGHINDNHMNLLSKEISAVMEMCFFKYAAKEDKTRFERMKSFFPEMFGNKTCLKNKFYNEYFFAGSDELARCSKRRNVFSWRLDEAPKPQSRWSLEAHSGTKLFKIKNNFHDEYLFVDDTVLCGRRRRVFTWRPKGVAVQGAADWAMERAEGGGFRIKNAARGEYLYASDDGHARSADMRNIFTWQSIREAVPNGDVWEIEECT